jgi:3'(2'), 5'-bisphosphate nucleotidase
MTSATLDDHRLARELATGAGELLVDLRAELMSTGADLATIKAEGDRQAHDWLMDQLATQRPDDAVLSEEGVDDDAPDVRRSRLDARRVWIVDPLDGTREFGEPPRDDWAVHVALCIDGEPLVGAVALPALGLTFCTEEPPVLSPSLHPRPRVLVSRTRPPVQASLVAEALDGDLVAMGSAGAKAMAVVRGAAEVYPHSGGQYEWDSCAPVAVARAAGLWCSRLDGSPLVYNRPDPYLPDLLICRSELAEAVLRAVRT